MSKMSKTKTKTKKILIVEDEASTIQALTEKLSEAGFVILQAKNGREGLKISLDKHPDLILLDIIMPKMDGLTMLKKLRKDNWGKNASVIILTNLTDPRKLSEAAGEAILGLWVKTDWRLDELVGAVKKKIK